MPTPSPGLKRVPRWRTMISPPLTGWPANSFTPSRLECESRPLRDEPNPFLCAILCLLGGLRLGRRFRDQLGLRLCRLRSLRSLWLRGLRLGRLRRLLRPRLDPSRGRHRLRLRLSRLGAPTAPAAAAPARQLDPHDLDPGQLLAVTGAAAVAPLGLELDHPELGAALVAHHPGLDLDR